MADLEAAGLRPNRMGPPDEPAAPPAESVFADLERLRRDLEAAHLRAVAAEALAQERLERIADLRMAFRALQSGSAHPLHHEALATDADAAVPDEPEQAAERGLKRVPGAYQRVPVKDLTPPPDREPDIVSLAIDAYKVLTPWRRRRP